MSDDDRNDTPSRNGAASDKPISDEPASEEPAAEDSGKSRGRLKIFLGAAPGVGKTYAMLDAAHTRTGEGIDVVAGFVDTHGRVETESLLKEIPVIPLRSTVFRERTYLEMDLDAILARKPQIVLVDDLSHTNIAGSRHLKRYQDVEEILAAGIDVYATLNILHLESLNDVVERIARIKVDETLPDSVLQEADEIELLDLSPDDLLKRLAEGKVHVPEQAQRSIKYFFATGTLTALREMALRHAAERVDAQMVGYMRAHAIAGPWPANERLMVCLDSGAQAERLVRQAKRTAERRQVPWLAVYVDDPAHNRLSEEAKDHITRAMQLAEQMDGETIVLQGGEAAAEILTLARKRNVTLILVERPHRSFLARLFKGRSLAEKLLREGEGIDILLSGYGEEEDTLSTRVLPLPREKPGWTAYLWATLSIAAASGLGIALFPYLPLSSILLLFLLAVLVSAIRLGMYPAIFASVLGFFVFNFFFTEKPLVPQHLVSPANSKEYLFVVNIFQEFFTHTKQLVGC